MFAGSIDYEILTQKKFFKKQKKELFDNEKIKQL